MVNDSRKFVIAKQNAQYWDIFNLNRRGGRIVQEYLKYISKPLYQLELHYAETKIFSRPVGFGGT